jgi:small-conductance mechanosensitive channel
MVTNLSVAILSIFKKEKVIIGRINIKIWRIVNMKYPMLPLILDFGTKLLAGLIIILIFWLISLAVKKIILTLSKNCDESKKDVAILLSQITWFTLLTFGIITGLGTMGINISALVAGLGLTGFALGFALKDALSNTLAGVLIVIYKPFQRNDLVWVTDSEGIVTEINLRYTTLQADGQKILIPNSIILNNKIIIKEKKNNLKNEENENKKEN